MTVALIITRTHVHTHTHKHTHNTTHNVVKPTYALDQVTKTSLITTGYWKHRDARRHFVIEAKLIKFDSKSRLQFLAYWNKNEVAYNVAIFRIIHSTSRYSARRRMGAGIKRCRDSSVPPSVDRTLAAALQATRAVRTADPSAHGRRSAAIGGGISSRRAITC